MHTVPGFSMVIRQLYYRYYICKHDFCYVCRASSTINEAIISDLLVI